MLYKDELTFLEKPASEDELMIAEVMRRFFEALQKNDLNLLLLVFREDARIDSKAAGSVVSLQQYASVMKDILPSINMVCFRDLIIRIENRTTAIVYGFSCYASKMKVGRWWRRMWKLNKINESWGIVESQYFGT